jgi:hypothetical protein
MSNISRFIAYGSSPITGSELPNADRSLAFTAIVANRIATEYICLGKPVTSNHKIARKIAEFEYQTGDFVFVLWTAANRYEVPTETGWTGFTVNSKAESGIVREWIDGPGQYEYTEICYTLESMLIAQAFLTQNNIPYAFSVDNDAFVNSYLLNNPERYLKSLKNMIAWNRFYTFNDSGFIDWARKNNYPFTGTHAGVEAHTSAADYVLSNWQTAF